MSAQYKKNGSGGNKQHDEGYEYYGGVGLLCPDWTDIVSLQITYTSY